MTVRVMSAGMPTTRYEDQSSPVLDGIGRAAQTLLELGPKLGQIKLERQRLDMDKQREQRFADNDAFEHGRQNEQDTMHKIQAAPGAYAGSPSPFQSSLAEQQQVEDATRMIPPAGYQEGLPHKAVPQVPIKGYAAALDNPPKNPYTAYTDLGELNDQNEMSHKPVQTRAGSVYEDTKQLKSAATNIAGRKLDSLQAYRDSMLPIKQQTADAATERAGNVDAGREQKLKIQVQNGLRQEFAHIDNKYKPSGFDMRNEAEKVQDEKKATAEKQAAAARWNAVLNDQPAPAEAAPQQEDSEDGLLQQLIQMNNARKAP